MNLEAVDRAALVVLTGHFQGFVSDLFVEAWDARYAGSSGAKLLERLRFNNPWPADIDALFSVMNVRSITTKAEPRPSASDTGPRKGLVVPVFARRRLQYQARQVIAEMVELRNGAVHGNLATTIHLNDVTSYVIDTVSIAIGMSRNL
jgi:hypothetical protein